MPKEALKRAISIEQNGVDPLTGEPLADEQKLNDTDRLVPKKDGGTYTIRDNVRVLTPVSHMKRHGIWRERTLESDELKAVFDDRVQMMKLYLKENNQVLAYKRRVDSQHPETLAFLEAHMQPIEKRIAQIDRQLAKMLKTYPDPLAQAALGVPGLGPITVTALTVYIDIAGVYSEEDRAVKEGIKTIGQQKAPTPSALWKYVGLHAPSHERYVKGEAGGGNKILRTVLYNTACTLMKMKDNPYRDVYDRTKLRLSQSEKIVKTRNTDGKMVELPWRETKPSHRHGAALRAIMKHVLADYWFVGRTLAGLPTTPLYAEAMLGHTHIIDPRARGWKF